MNFERAVFNSVVAFNELKDLSFRFIDTMFKDEFLDKFFNLSITHGISDIDCEINNDIGYGFEVVVSKISLRIQLTKGIDNITPDMMETLYKLPMHSCTIFEDVSWTS